MVKRTKRLDFRELGSYEEFATMEMDRLYEKWLAAKQKAKRLESGPGGIMEMKQTIADKEKEIEQLHVALREIALLNNQRDRFSSQIDFIICQILNEKK